MISPRASDDHLLEGDCLDVLPQIEASSIDLIYLDPPFNTGRVHKGKSEASFDDRFLSVEDYIAFLKPRIEGLRRVLKDTGSIYLHCDPTMSHYLKVMMDGVFGVDNFRNEIIWCYTGPGSPNARQFPRKHDAIFWYSKSGAWTFNADAVRVPYGGKYGKPHGGGFKGNGPSIEDPRYEQRGKIPESWWSDIAVAVRSSRERTGYPTQKPVALLERIIKASSNEDDLVLDPFCGSGTTCVAAQRLGRRYIGIDKSPDAIKIARQRLAASLI